MIYVPGTEGTEGQGSEGGTRRFGAEEERRKEMRVLHSCNIVIMLNYLSGCESH